MGTRKDKHAAEAGPVKAKAKTPTRPAHGERDRPMSSRARKSEVGELAEAAEEVIEAELEGDASDVSEESSEPADVIDADILEVGPDDAELAAIEAEPLDDDLDIDAELAPKKQLPATRHGRLPEALSALNVYLARLKHVQILPIEEQAQLAAEYQRSGDKDAAARLVASNLRLVVKIAFQFRRQWADVMDLIAEGNLGLAEAIRKFDADRGIPFPSYARFWIRARILAFIQENKHLIHAGSRAARKLFWRLERERRQLISEGSEPEPRLLAERVGVTETDIRELAPILDQRPVSLDVPVHGDEDGRTRGEVMSDPGSTDPEAEVGGEEIQDTLKKVFAEYRETLDERERAIWDMRLQNEEPVRLEDLGEQFGVSKERVRQLEVRIKKRLKDFVQRRLGNEVIIEALH
jgi:RNA polymerase sigma-32 factor